MAGAMVVAAYGAASARRAGAGSLTRMAEPGPASLGGKAGAETAVPAPAVSIAPRHHGKLRRRPPVEDYLQTSIHDRQV